MEKLRKGAWTYEEDKLLKACISKYGEGKWHLVPQRAGLNRCRKSCRLRWLNYLKPTINRGTFAEDEVDMILRLHKLLGNRWSLIAGRLPGRTANDVKNYWHTHLGKKVDSNKEERIEKEKPRETMKTHYEVIKPQPRTLFKNKPQPRTFSSNLSPWLNGKHNNFGSGGGVRECATPLVASNEDVNVQKECDTETTMLPYECHSGDSGGGDRDCTAQPCHGNAPVLSTVWWENLWNMEEQVGNEKIGIQSLLEEENSILEFPKDFFSTEGPIDSDCYLDFNLCDVDSLWNL